MDYSVIPRSKPNFPVDVHVCFKHIWDDTEHHSSGDALADRLTLHRMEESLQEPSAHTVYGSAIPLLVRALLLRPDFSLSTPLLLLSSHILGRDPARIHRNGSGHLDVHFQQAHVRKFRQDIPSGNTEAAEGFVGCVASSRIRRCRPLHRLQPSRWKRCEVLCVVPISVEVARALR